MKKAAVEKEIQAFDEKHFVLHSKQELRKMSSEAVDQYFRDYRLYLYKKGLLVEKKTIIKRFHPLIVSFLKIDRLVSRRKLIINRDDRIYNNRPRIYCSTHVGRHDVETGLEAIGEQAFLVQGDPNETYLDIDGFLLDLNGRISLNTRKEYATDRYIAYENMKQHLLNGYNIFIFPEGAENIFGYHFKTYNYYDYPYMFLDDVIKQYGFVMKHFSGAARLAVETGADIIPMSIYRIKSGHYVVSFGNNLNFNNESIDDAEILEDVIRTAQATLHWENMEKYGQKIRRDHIDSFEHEAELFTSDVMHHMPKTYTEADVEETRFQEQMKTAGQWKCYNEQLYEYEQKYLHI